MIHVQHAEPAPSSKNARRVAVDWSKRPLRELMRHIVDEHHTRTRERLDELRALVLEVARQQGDTSYELDEIRHWLVDLDDELRPHMAREEIVLFPYIEDLETALRAGRARIVPPFGDVANPVRRMMVEHDHSGAMLRQLREATSAYSAPRGASKAERALYAGLEALEADLLEHMHLETDILFPRAQALEEASASPSTPPRARTECAHAHESRGARKDRRA